MFDIPCIIFAGGKSSRMGEDKSLLPFGSFNTLTQYQLHKLQKLFKNVYISCKSSNKFDFKANFIEDVKTQNVYAPTAGFVAIFEKLNYDRFFILSVDAPFVNEYVINELIKEDKASFDATIAKTEFGIQPMCGIYHKSLANNFKKMLKDDNHKLGYLLKNSQTNFVKFTNNTLFLNVNDKKEYKKALNQLNLI